MEFEVVKVGNCMICRKSIKVVVPIGYDKLPNIWFCRECEPQLEYDRKRPERI